MLGVMMSLTLLMATAAFADTALVVGVNKYPGLQEGNQNHDLNGCVNDAKSVADALKKRGFDNVIFLSDEQATKENILGTLKGLKLKSAERFAFYFAGHGTTSTSGDSCLLTNKSTFDSEDNDVQAKDLYGAVSTLRCKSRTVMMDSCFSGGMMISSRSLSRSTHTFTPRGYVRKGFSPTTIPANGGEKSITGLVSTRAAAADVCYLAAAKANEQALEDRFGTQVHGVFTQYLIAEIGKGDQQCWGDVHAAIGQEVEERTDRLQHPLLSPGYNDKPLFGGPKQEEVTPPSQPDVKPVVAPDTKPVVTPPDIKPIVVPDTKPVVTPDTKPVVTPDTKPVVTPDTKPVVTPDTKPVVTPPDVKPPVKPDTKPTPLATDKKWDVYHNQNVDPSKVKIELTPNNTTLVVKKDNFSLNATVGEEGGYLVIMERGTSGNVNLLFPRDEISVASAKVKPGQKIALPGPDRVFECDEAGHEYIKVILFQNEQGVKALLDIFSKSPVVTGRAILHGKDLFVVDTHHDAKSMGFFTSDVTFEVVDKP